MFYLIHADHQRTIAETLDRAAALVARGWELTTREHYMALWTIEATDRVEQLIAAAHNAPLLERELGGHYL